MQPPSHTATATWPLTQPHTATHSPHKHTWPHTAAHSLGRASLSAFWAWDHNPEGGVGGEQWTPHKLRNSPPQLGLEALLKGVSSRSQGAACQAHHNTPRRNHPGEGEGPRNPPGLSRSGQSGNMGQAQPCCWTADGSGWSGFWSTQQKVPLLVQRGALGDGPIFP